MEVARQTAVPPRPERCPHCGSPDLRPCDVMLTTSGHLEDVRSNVECKRCLTRFRWTPPGRVM